MRLMLQRGQGGRESISYLLANCSIIGNLHVVDARERVRGREIRLCNSTDGKTARQSSSIRFRCRNSRHVGSTHREWTCPHANGPQQTPIPSSQYVGLLNGAHNDPGAGAERGVRVGAAVELLHFLVQRAQQAGQVCRLLAADGHKGEDLRGKERGGRTQLADEQKGRKKGTCGGATMATLPSAAQAPSHTVVCIINSS